MNFPNKFPTNFPTNFPNDIKMIVRKLLSNNYFRNINREYHNIYVLNDDMIVCFICFNGNQPGYVFNYRNIKYVSCGGFRIIYHFQTPTNYYLPDKYWYWY